MPTTAPNSDLARQIRASAEESRTGHQLLAVRVRLAAHGTTLTTCELWSAGTGVWKSHAVLDAGVGKTLGDVQQAVLAAGYRHGLTGDGQPRAAWRYDANDGWYTLDLTPAAIATAR
jgi:hypothetical protein